MYLSQNVKTIYYHDAPHTKPIAYQVVIIKYFEFFMTMDIVKFIYSLTKVEGSTRKIEMDIQYKTYCYT